VGKKEGGGGREESGRKESQGVEDVNDRREEGQGEKRLREEIS